MNKDCEISVILVSPPELECLTAEIHMDGVYLCRLTQEQGPTMMKVEFDENQKRGDIDLDLLELALATAKVRLLGKKA